MCEKSSKQWQFQDQQAQILSIKKKFKYENIIKKKNKPDPALVGGSYLFNEIKKDTKISWDYPFKALKKIKRRVGFQLINKQ
jgi:hypothetical protein